MKKLALATLLLFSTYNVFASTTGISLSYGFSGVDGMSGFALNSKKYWGTITNIGSAFELTGLWDFGLAYWQTTKSKNTEFSNITILSAMPILRFERRLAYDNGIAPFVDLGYGVGLLNRDQFSNQQLGGYGTFIFSAGGGINFGAQSQYDLSYHYLNYNNAGQFKHDDGMYLNTISFTYRFAGAS